jgi:hypothetical protein
MESLSGQIRMVVCNAISVIRFMIETEVKAHEKICWITSALKKSRSNEMTVV